MIMVGGGPAHNGWVIDEAELRRMSPEDRRQLAQALARIDLPHPLLEPGVVRRRQFGMIITMASCLALAVWIVYLALTLPRHFTSVHWRAVWVGLDIAELIGFAMTAWAAWFQRQILILCMIVTGTLLVSDAWFDVMLDSGTPDAKMSFIAAVFAELPLAFILFSSARRLMRFTVEAVMRLEGISGPVPPLWRVPLFADGLEEALPSRLRSRDARTSRDKAGASQGGELSRLDWHGHRPDLGGNAPARAPRVIHREYHCRLKASRQRYRPRDRAARAHPGR